jgi:hypothetical protein
LCERLLAGLTGLAKGQASLVPGAVPLVALTLDDPPSALELLRRLQDYDPSIRADPSRIAERTVLFNPLCLREDDPEVIARAVSRLL